VLLSDVVTFHARVRPDDPALIFDEIVTSYSKLSGQLHRVANGMANLAQPGDRVAILSENRPEYVDCYYGVPRAGMGLCVLNFRLAAREILRIVNDAEPVVLVTEEPYLELVRSLRGQMPSVKHVVIAGNGASKDEISYDDLVAGSPCAPPAYEPSPDSLAWLIYTSGTTGMPKGAMLSHRQLLAAVEATVMSWEREYREVELLPWPMCHVSGTLYPMAHILGNTIVAMRSYDPEEFLALVERHRCTRVSVAPTMLHLLTRHARFDDFDRSSLKRIVYGAAPMPAEVLRTAMTKLPGIRFIGGYGSTELGGIVTYLDPIQHLEALENNRPLLASIGRSLPMSEIRVVDDEMNDVREGDVGEIVVRGDQVMSGYWRQLEATKEAFFGGWFHTGDLARLDGDGNLYIVDRKKDMILTGGENVYSREVEEVLYTHPGVAEAAVIGLPDPVWGEKVVAVIQPRAGFTLLEDDIIKLCRSNLASYKKPKHVVFVDELPRNTTGKILKRELRDNISGRF
jgi:acyl-CoA synthetase (AMP-forming)/AMP-acid ligase II